MKSKLKAVYERLGRPSPLRIGVVLLLVAACVLAVAAFLGSDRVVWALSLLMSLLTIGALLLVWNEAHTARIEARESAERAETTFRRILAAIEVERLAAEHRRAAGGESDVLPD